MASHFAPVFLTFCAFVLQVSSQLDCPSGPDYVLEPSTLSDTVHLLRTDSAEEARNAALCHVACINYVFADGSNGTNGTNETASGSNGGLLEPNMISRILQLNCKELKQYLDCRSGCIAAVMDDTNCVDTCSGRCQGICSFRECFGFDGNRCGAKCNANDCSVGCYQHSINQLTDTLAQPTDPPSLIQQDDMEEVYDVIIPSELDASEYPSLVFRIETQPGQFTYQWMVNIDTTFVDATITEYILDLVSFTGHTISVSFAYATLNGFSEYSEAIILGGLEVDFVSPSDIVHRMVTNNSDEARTAALCHVMCLDFIFEGGNGTNGTNFTMMSNDSNNESMTEGDLVLGCTQFRQYVDCRTGCIRQSTGEGDCQTSCSERCQDICQFRECFGFDGNKCGVGCNSLECGDGCMLYSMIENIPLMPSTMNSPQLTRDRQNKYNFSLPDELENYENPSVVFRIETENDLVYYQWMVEVEINYVTATMFNDIKLDLSSYPGQRLNIAYAFATPDAGITSYSESTEVVVPAQCVVRDLEITTDQIKIVSAERDTRAGFFNHRVLNVTWCPSSCTEEVSHYHITRRGLGGSCGGTVELNTKLNDATTSSALVYSTDEGSPNLPCTVEVQVSTVLSDGSVVEGGTRTRIWIRGARDEFDDITVECPLLYYDSSLMKYRVNLTFIAPFSQATLSHIQTFFYRGDVFRLLDPTNPNDITLIEVGQDNARIDVNINQTIYNFPVTIDPLTELKNFYKLSIQVVWMSPAGPAISDSCNIFDALAPPPLPIQYINITEVNTQRVLPSINNPNSVEVTFFISFNWLEPELQFSGDNITYYEVYIGQRVLEQDESTTTQTFDETEGSLTITFTGVRRGSTIINAFLQIRSFQYDDIPSNWSIAEPVEIIVLQVNDVRNFEVELTGVNVECDGDQIYLILNANTNWDDAFDDETNEVLLQYVLTVGDVSTTYDGNILSAPLIDQRFPLSDNFTLDVVFSIIARKTLKGEELESLDPDTEIRIFQALPFPEDINITSINPRLVGAGSSYTLSVSMTIDWHNPLTEMTITDYEIRFTTDNSTLCAFDAFNDHSEERMITANNMTQFNTSISEQISVPSPQLFVQMRSIVEGDIMLLPQWSDPILVSLDVLTPPNITNSQLLSLQLTTNSLIDFLMETSIELSWTEPEGGSEGLLFYEVWIGSIALEEYEESENLGEIIQVPINTEETGSGTTINITQVLSAEFLSESNNRIVYIQIRSVGPNAIPKWSPAEVIQSVPPTIVINISPTGSLYAGTSLTLTCTMTLDPAVNNNEYIIIEWSGHQSVSEDRYTVSDIMRGSDSNYTATLIISPLAVQDDDVMITCTVTVTGATANDDVTINVMALPAPIVTISPASDVLTVGQSYTLTCNVMVVPHLVVEPTIQWTKYDGTSVITSSSSGTSLQLNFYPIMTSDSNVYTCRASIDITDFTLSVTSESTWEILLAVPSGTPEMFDTVFGERQAMFSWSPPLVTERNGVIITYTLSCSPSPSTLPLSISQAVPVTVTGFTPDTRYICSVMAHNGLGAGPAAQETFTTQPDYAYFQLRLTGLRPCSELIFTSTDDKLDDITSAVLIVVCGDDCDITSDIIDIPSFDCDPDSTTTVIYLARLSGTSERDSDYLITVIQDWVNDGASIIVAGILMTVDTKCMIFIPSLNERECVPFTETPSETPTSDPNPDSTASSATDNTAAIIGGVVTVILIIAITVLLITMLILLKSRRHGDVSIKNAPEKHELSVLSGSPVKGVSIATSTNAAYEMMKQGPGVESEGYEVIPQRGGPTLTGVEAAYEVPSVPDQPLPDIPSPLCKTGQEKDDEEEEEDGVYETIPGDN